MNGNQPITFVLSTLTKFHYDVDAEWMVSHGYANARPKLRLTAVPRFSFATATVTTLTTTPTRGGYIK